MRPPHHAAFAQGCVIAKDCGTAVSYTHLVVAHHQPRLVAIQQTPEDRSGDDAGEVEAEDDEAHRRTRAGRLQHEPKQGDDGELVPEIRDAQAQPKPLKRGMAQ